MREKIKRWLHYRIARLSIRAKWTRLELPKLSNVQERTLKIAMSLMKNPDSELLINPSIDENNSEKYYIKKYNENGEPSIFVTIGRSSNGYIINVIGSEDVEGKEIRYHYDIWFNEICGKFLVNKFNRILRNRRNKMEGEIRKGDEETLDLILRKLEK